MTEMGHSHHIDTPAPLVACPLRLQLRPK